MYLNMLSWVIRYGYIDARLALESLAMSSSHPPPQSWTELVLHHQFVLRAAKAKPQQTMAKKTADASTVSQNKRVLDFPPVDQFGSLSGHEASSHLILVSVRWIDEKK